MLNNRLAAAQLVAGHLNNCENAIDDALIRAAELTCAVPAARRTANLSPVVAQDAVALAGEAIAALHEARAKIVAAHEAFAVVRDGMGLSTRMGGDLWKIPAEGKASYLTVVGKQAA